MEEPEFKVFTILYREACSRCFGLPLTQPLTEVEGKLFQQQLLDHTGLVVGWRSLKNYSLFVLHIKKQENPSIASMDTLARYVLKAPYTNEIDRKDHENHHPYWFAYRERHLAQTIAPKVELRNLRWLWAVASLVLVWSAFYLWNQRKTNISFTDDFADLSEKSLQDRDWQVIDKDDKYWERRAINKNMLTLFTLPGDNWPDSAARPEIKNMLLRDLPGGCFTTELQMEGFVPAGQWQQAGLLLLESTDLNGPSLRISLAYNNFFGGFNKPAEVLVQAILTPGNGGKPEEFVHNTVLTLDSSASRPVILNNLQQTALRIEKQGTKFRLLYAGGAAGNAAFKELSLKELNIHPKFVAIFALKGRVENTKVAQVKIKKFLLKSMACN